MFHCSDVNTDSPPPSNRVKLEKKRPRNVTFHSDTSQKSSVLKVGINICRT